MAIHLTKIEHLYEEACQQALNYEIMLKHKSHLVDSIYTYIHINEMMWYWRGRRDTLYMLLKVKNIER